MLKFCVVFTNAFLAAWLPVAEKARYLEQFDEANRKLMYEQVLAFGQNSVSKMPLKSDILDTPNETKLERDLTGSEQFFKLLRFENRENLDELPNPIGG